MADMFVFLLQWGHVTFAVFLIGGGVFFEFITKPQLMANLDAPNAGKVTMAIGKKFTILVFTAWTVIILSGLYRAFIVQSADIFTMHNDGYGFTLEVKMGIVAITFALSILMTKTSIDLEKAEPQLQAPLVKRMGYIAKTISVLGVTIVFFAVALRHNVYLI